MNQNPSLTLVADDSPSAVAPVSSVGNTGLGSASSGPPWVNWLEEIRRLFDCGKASTLELARTVSRAKQILCHRGEWSQVWHSANAPFSKRKADMLVRIGHRLGTLDAQTFAQLPPGWSVLYYLAQLERAVLRKLVQEGIIHPRLTLREAKRLVGGERAGRPREGRSVRRRVAAFESVVTSTIHEWPAPERAWVAARLTQLVSQIKQYQSSTKAHAA